ncbi:MAG: hypothetical protein IRZ07_16020 [Microbispora sp.]|nr:hypothetical protein [Microbispora sp.]
MPVAVDGRFRGDRDLEPLHARIPSPFSAPGIPGMPNKGIRHPLAGQDPTRAGNDQPAIENRRPLIGAASRK